MSNETVQLLMQAAADVAAVVSSVTMRWYRSNSLAVVTKGDGSPVTVADRDGELAAREWLSKRFPGYGFLGEEFGAANPDAPRRWIVDPIDGTKAFVRGVPLWGTLVACCEGDRVLAGAAHYPAVNEVVVAASGEGCWWNSVRAKVSPVSSLRDATALITDDRFPERPERRYRWQQLAGQTAVMRTWGDCYGYLLVATGRAEIMVDDVVNAWDTAALQPIIVEAGGVFTDWRGVSSPFAKDVVATNRGVAVATRNLLQEPHVHS